MKYLKRKTENYIELVNKLIVLMGSDLMKKHEAKIVNFKEYKERKQKISTDRKELLQLIKKVVTTK